MDFADTFAACKVRNYLRIISKRAAQCNGALAAAAAAGWIGGEGPRPRPVAGPAIRRRPGWSLYSRI